MFMKLSSLRTYLKHENGGQIIKMKEMHFYIYLAKHAKEEEDQHISSDNQRSARKIFLLSIILFSIIKANTKAIEWHLCVHFEHKKNPQE